MTRTIQLSVPSPCSQRWRDFAVTPAGGFCASCNKTVVDFTRMGDDEIAQFFRARPVHTCGQFTPAQLKEYLVWEPGRIRPGRALLAAGLMSLILIIVGKPAQAQNPTDPQKVESIRSTPEAGQKASKVDRYRVVRGSVRDRVDESPVPGVNVMLKGSTERTVTDVDGWFKFPIKLQDNDVLIFSFIGFSTLEYVVPGSGNAEVVMDVELDYEVMFLGEVAVTDVYAPRKGFDALWSKIISLF